METLIAPNPTSTVNRPAPPTAARAAAALLFFMNGALFASWVSRIPAIQAARGLSHETLGFALFGVALGALVAMPLAGWGVTRWGSHRISQGTALGFCVSLPWLAVAPNAWWLGVALFGFGALHGALDVAMNAQAVAIEGRYGRPIMSSFHALWSLGGLTGSALGGVVAAGQIGPWMHFCVAALVLGGGTLLWAWPRLLDAGEVEAWANSKNQGPNSKRSAGASKTTGLFWPPRVLLALGAVAFCIMLGEGAMADWSAIFLRDNTGASEGLAAAGYAAFSIAMAGARFGGDALATRFGAVALVRAGSLLAAAGLTVALLGGRPMLALAGFAAVGAGFATIVPQVFSAAGRAAGVAPGPALAITTTVGYAGFLIGPPLIGFAAQHLGLRTALGLVVVMCAVAVALAPNVDPPHRASAGS